MLVYWEMTQACGLACRHCRAEAMANPSPLELSTAEGKSLLKQIKEFGTPLPHLILTGGIRLAVKTSIRCLILPASLAWRFPSLPARPRS